MNEDHAREDLAGAEWHDRHLIRDTFTDCRMTGLEAPELVAEHVVFTGCRLDLANFRNARLRFVTFDDCVLDDADFGGARIEHCRFSKCSLRRTYLEHVRFTKTDLRGSALEPDGSLLALKGATIDPVQLVDLAPALARDAGIEVLAADG